MPIQPVRKIGMSHRSITGKRSTLKNTGILQFESALERDLLTLLEYDDDIAEIGVQPMKIFYESEGFSSRYTPDVLIKYHTRLDRKPVIYEVKYAAELEEKKHEYEARFRAAERFAAEPGYEFRVITEREIRTDYLWNIKFLSPFSNNIINESYLQLILIQFTPGSALTPKSIVEKFDQDSRSDVLRTLWEMLAAKNLRCNMTEKITMNTSLWN